MTDYKQLCAELLSELKNAIRVIYGEDGTQHISSADPVIAKVDTALAESDPFDMVQHQLDMLAGDEEMVIYRWSDGYWSIDHTNPSNSVKLGESNGEYESTGSSLKEAVINLEAILPNHPLI